MLNVDGACGGGSGINPCLNGGGCTQNPQEPVKYNCTCIQGYTGTNCDVCKYMFVMFNKPVMSLNSNHSAKLANVL